MKILLATDGSDTARATVDFLLGFPLPSATEVTVMTVISEVLHGDEMQGLSDEQRQAFDDLRRREDSDAQNLLDGEVERLRQGGFKASGEIRTGHAAEEIVRLAAELKSDIIAVGSHGLSGVKRFLLGSVSDRVFEYAPCSVLIVKQPAAAGGGQAVFPTTNEEWRLLLAYDDSVPARKAMELCASLPLAARAEIKVITVLPLIRMYRQDIRQQLSSVWQEKKRAAKMALEWATSKVDSKDGHVSTQLLEEPDVAQAILDVADDFGSHLLIVGHKGKQAFARFLRGSVASRLAHHAPCSVLSVRTCDQASESGRR